MTQFAQSVGMKGFFSSMFFSNESEAIFNDCFRTNAETITQEETLFCQRVNQLIQKNTPMGQWVEALRSQANLTQEVVKFNYDGLRYFD